MNTPVITQQKQFDYAAFIEEIRKLRDQANGALSDYTPEGIQILRDEQQATIQNNEPWEYERWNWKHDEFKMWLEQVKYNLEAIKRLNYPVKIHILVRDFQSPHGDDEYADSLVARERAFVRDLGDTAREMTVEIRHFDKYGTPADSFGNKPNTSVILTTGAGENLTRVDPETFFKDKPSLSWLIKHLPLS